ncbi:MAG: sigma-70 family RNA polymerase sigma factor [Candidatus Kuenenia sp.]|nr:sigma-70 family RNA polymerase sigma factor [Candidatus Kuenenia hertensis]
MTKEDLELIALRDTAKKGGEEGKKSTEKFFEIIEPLIQMYVTLTVKYYPSHLTRNDCVHEMRYIAFDVFLKEWNPCISSFRTCFSGRKQRIYDALKEHHSIFHNENKLISIDEPIHDKNGTEESILDTEPDKKTKPPDIQATNFELQEHVNTLFNSALAKLSGDEKEVFLAHTFGELKLTEIADKMGKPYNTVKSYYERAKQKLKSNNKLKKLFEEGDK